MPEAKLLVVPGSPPRLMTLGAAIAGVADGAAAVGVVSHGIVFSLG
jgi:hypothetical protein